MKKTLILLIALLSTVLRAEAKDLVVYFSATGNTAAIAQQIAQVTGADLLRIEAAEPYAANPYDDSNRIQREAYKDLRPAVGNLPSAETIAQYDRIFVGSPIWWHQPAMVMCTFLESFDLSSKTIIPFFTYGATTYLNEAMHKIYKVTPDSRHVPATLPEDLNPDDITTPGPADDSGIDMPSGARDVENWLQRLGLDVTGIHAVSAQTDVNIPFTIHTNENFVEVDVDSRLAHANTLCVYHTNGAQLFQANNQANYTLQLPHHATYLFTMADMQGSRDYSRKIAY